MANLTLSEEEVSRERGIRLHGSHFIQTYKVYINSDRSYSDKENELKGHANNFIRCCEQVIRFCQSLREKLVRYNSMSEYIALLAFENPYGHSRLECAGRSQCK